MAGKNLVDPWTTMKELCVVQLNEVNTAYRQFEAALMQTDTESNPTYKKKKKKLNAKLDSAKKITSQMDLAVRAISRQRANFPNVDDEDLKMRKDYVTSTQGRLREIQDAVRSQRTRDKVAADRRAALTVGGGSKGKNNGSGSNTTKNSSSSNSDFMQDQMEQQKEIRGQQDEILDNMIDGVENLGEQAKVINQTLEEESQLLAQFELEMEEAQAKMNVVMRTMSKLLKTKDTCQLWLILFLTLTIVILAFLVFYTD
jgi:syntaxin 6